MEENIWKEDDKDICLNSWANNNNNIINTNLMKMSKNRFDNSLMSTLNQVSEEGEVADDCISFPESCFCFPLSVGMHKRASSEKGLPQVQFHHSSSVLEPFAGSM